MDAFAIISILLVIWLARTLLPPRSHKGIETVGRSWKNALILDNPVSDLVEKGYRNIIKASQKPFLVRYWDKDYVILPLKYLIDVKHADKKHLSFNDSIPDVFFLNFWVGDLYQNDRMVYTVKKGLNPQLPEASDICLNEAAYAFEAEFGDCTEIKRFNAIQTLTNATIRAVTPVIVGEELARDEEFLKAANTYFQGNFLTGVILLKLPLGIFRAILGSPIAYFQRRNLRKIVGIVSPVVLKRIREKAQRIQKPRRIDGIEWTLKLAEQDQTDTEQSTLICTELIQSLWAAGASPAAIITQMVFHVLADPSYLEPMRKEVEDAVAKHGWSEKIINDLPLQDSFIREVNRFYPIFTLNCTRTVIHKPFKFCDGFTLPAGTRFAFPAGPSQLDPDHCDNPDQFDGFRFAKLTKAESRADDKVNTWAASHVGPANLTFGFGNHVCPGRFFAVRIMKIIFSKLIYEYDISWDRTEPGQPSVFKIEGLSTPNHLQAIFLEKRVLP
ncbi:MAG: hypothetical protein MMC33_002275 [Icmadophila ericetorum]|nr:hypothetical protein [Icmadophila ericetorum]